LLAGSNNFSRQTTPRHHSTTTIDPSIENYFSKNTVEQCLKKKNMLGRTLSRNFTSDKSSTGQIRLWPRRVLLDHGLSLWHPTGTRLTVTSVQSLAATMAKTLDTPTTSPHSGKGFSILENLWLQASKSVLRWKADDAALLFSYYMVLMQLLETNAKGGTDDPYTNTPITNANAIAIATATEDTASGAERLSQFIVFLFAQLYHHTDASLKTSQKLLDANVGDQPALKAALLSSQKKLSVKAHEQNEAAPISPPQTGTALSIDTAHTPPRTKKSGASSSAASPSPSPSPSSPPTSPSLSQRSVAIQSRAEDDAEHLMFVENHLEVLVNTLQACFPVKGTDNASKDRLSDAAMSGVELLLSGPDTFAVRARGRKPSSTSSSTKDDKDNDPDTSLLRFIRDHLVVCEPLSSELHHTPTLDIHGYTRTTIIQTSTQTSKVVEGVATTENTPSSSSSTTPSSTLQDAHVANCRHSFLYVLLPVRFAVVQSCEDCTIVIGACQGVLSLERCERVTILCCGQQLRISNCIDCTIYSYTPRSPMLLGDNRGLQFAPYSTYYTSLSEHLVRTGLNTKEGTPMKDLWDQILNLDDNTTKDLTSGKATSYKLMNPNDFYPFEIPSLTNSNTNDMEQNNMDSAKCLPPTPMEYSQALQRKVS